MPLRLFFVLSLASLALGGCRAATDLGRECALVRANPDGGTALKILESDLPDGGTGKDYISFGATECEDLVCVRDSNVQKTGIPGALASGYCSRACVPNSSVGCP